MTTTVFAAGGTFSGTGTEADPYLIEDLDDLKAFRDAVNGGNDYTGKYVKLAADITLSGEWTPIGTGQRSGSGYSGHPFKGTFDGGDKTISGLTITTTGGADYALGLFGIVDDGTVKNIKLTNVNINVPSSELAGGAIGILTGEGTADNITVSGSVKATRGNGGIVGRMLISGTISNCTNNAAMSATGANVGGTNGATIDMAPVVRGGTFNGDITSTVPSGFISGGTFNKEVPEELCADGYEPQANNDGTYGVKPEGGTNNGGTVVPGGSGAGSSSTNTNVPVTGDNTPITLLIVLMGICAAAIAAVIVSRKRASR